MNNAFKLSLVAAAVGLAAAGTASANSVGAPQYIGAGASAVKNTIVRAVVGVNGTASTVCPSGSTVDYYDNATADITVGTAIPGGSVFRIVCTNAGTVVLDVSYDTNGGSWKSLIAAVPSTATVSPLFANAQSISGTPVQYNDITVGTKSAVSVTQFSAGGTTFTFVNPMTYHYGATVINAVPGTDSVDFGLADIENPLWNDPHNQPLQADLVTPVFGNGEILTVLNGTTRAPVEAAGYPKPAFGVVFGVAVSPTLYAALQTAQGLNGTVYDTAGVAHSCAGVQGYADTTPAHICVPSISKADYRSLASGNASASLATIYGNVEVARRDQGSGSQGNSNAFFFNDGCSVAQAGVSEAKDLSPALPATVLPANITVTYQTSTGNVLTRIKNTTTNVIGVVGLDSDSAGKLGTGSFVKIDGIYPSSAAAGTTGYDFVGMETLHCSKTAGVSTFCAALTTDFSTNLTTAGGFVNLTTANFSNNSVACGGQRRIR